MIHRRAVARLLVLAALLLGGTLPARAQPAADSTAIPEPTGFVNDHAGVLTEPERARLEGFLDQLRTKTGAEFAVLAVRSTAPETPEEYKVRVFERWGLGRRGQDDGLLLLVAIEERAALFETGYGLEGTLPDGFQSRVFRREMRPRFRDGDYAGGITAGVLASAARIAAEKGVTLEWDGRELRYSQRSDGELSGWKVALILGFVFFLVIPAVMASPRRRRRRGWYWGGPWDGRGLGGGWGGGFGGNWGGGRGGFGGFGGGMSGGGGGGGRW